MRPSRLLLGVLPLLLAACAAAPGPVAGTPAAAAAPSAEPPRPSCVDTVLAGLDRRAVAGQLIVVGAPLGAAVGPSVDLVKRLPVGGVLLTGRSRSGVAAVAARTGALQRAVTGRVGLLVAADQEGGQVQTLTGPGFTAIPTAVEQGRWSTAKLTDAAAGWGGELKAAGVNLDLAPVSDVLSAQLGPSNLAVGVSRRTFGTEPAAVGSGVLAFSDGLSRAGVAAAVKHFPGLGQVRANTDHTANVRDTTTDADSPWLEPFRRAITAGVPVVMVSSAVYTRIDATQPAAFSRPVVTDLLRTQLGFAGVVISDDLGRAVAVAAVPAAQRAVRFVAAGGDLVLTVDPQTAGPMIDALVAKAATDPEFAAALIASARRVLDLKHAQGLLRC
ncbi:MAG TPA: glycoside hydrolase family 3 N-terminal domain-containing protein [Pseudonocardia sp.]|nr:glycoside hydrolase family 3 N-terminal domain-containing protein [Pseudonocardia sp.]